MEQVLGGSQARPYQVVRWPGTDGGGSRFAREAALQLWGLSGVGIPAAARFRVCDSRWPSVWMPGEAGIGTQVWPCAGSFVKGWGLGPNQLPMG